MRDLNIASEKDVNYHKLIKIKIICDKIFIFIKMVLQAENFLDFR